MKALFAIALAMGITFAACTDNTAPTEPTSAKGLDKTVQSDFDLDGGWMYNPCCDSYISLSGSVHNNMNITFNPDGSVSGYAHGNYQGVGGTDQNGNKYRIVGSATQQVNIESTGAGTFRIVYHTRMQATGGNDGCTFVVKQVIEYSIDEYGNLTVVSDKTTIECV